MGRRGFDNFSLVVQELLQPQYNPGAGFFLPFWKKGTREVIPWKHSPSTMFLLGRSQFFTQMPVIFTATAFCFQHLSVLDFVMDWRRIWFIWIISPQSPFQDICVTETFKFDTSFKTLYLFYLFNLSICLFLVEKLGDSSYLRLMAITSVFLACRWCVWLVWTKDRNNWGKCSSGSRISAFCEPASIGASGQIPPRHSSHSCCSSWSWQHEIVFLWTSEACQSCIPFQ